MNDHISSTNKIFPNTIIHCDWGVSSKKRWLARAELSQGYFRVEEPEPLTSVDLFLGHIRARANNECVLLGFDFPIGLPISYARLAGIESFLTFLREFGQGKWENFSRVAHVKEEISLKSPFYPFRPGGTSFRHLLNQLGFCERRELLRECESSKPVACPLFWTLGPKQVGKGALSGWREVIVPLLSDEILSVAVWPFSGSLQECLQKYRIVIAETYPAEGYKYLKFPKFRKTKQHDRLNRWKEINFWIARQSNVLLDPSAKIAAHTGFGSGKNGEDRFDAFVGLCHMIGVVTGDCAEGSPEDHATRTIEGWILGRSRSSQKV